MAQTQAHQRRNQSSLWLRLAPLVFLLLWSSGFAFAAIGLAYTGPITFLALRYALVVAVLLPLLLVLRPPLPRGAAQWGHLAAVGFLVQVVYFGLLYVAIALRVPAGTVALIVSLNPILVALASPRLTGERVGALRWVGLGLGLAGAALVIASRSDVRVASAVGLLCAAGAPLGMAAATLYERRFGLEQHPVTANVVQYVVGFGATLPLAWEFEGLRVAWTADLVLSLVYLAVANSLISITLLLAMVRRGEASRVSALFFLVPPIAALIAWTLIGERMPPLGWAGMAIAAVGVSIAVRSASGPRRS